MPLSTLVASLALGALATFLAGAGRRTLRTRRTRPGTPDDGPLGLGAGRTARCPVCAAMTLELIGVGVGEGARDGVAQVRCGSCLSSYTVRGSLAVVPMQGRRAA